MKKLYAVSEAEAIGEFLRNEFHEAQYNFDRDRFESYVLKPDFSDVHANAVRRALLFRRRGHMWRELPKDTQWWRVKIEPSDLANVHVFPRAQWRKISNGSYSIGDVVDRIRERRYKDGGNEVIAKIQQVRYRLQAESYTRSTVLLIGLDETKPVTILEGNHRFAAAMLVSPLIASTHFSVLCGMSAHMTECCWYHTNFNNLWHYACNRLTHLYDREADVNRFLPKKELVLTDTLTAKNVTGTRT
ncbi:MAG TPA: hypothetical protein VMZ25_08815 [Terriglobales bacterium]|nr:hypothetical protein [Terriglobales bacterium]